MKKITLVLSSMLLTAGSAFAAADGKSYVIVPADANVETSGKYLSATADGHVSYANELSAATLWDYSSEQLPDWTVVDYIKNGDKYLSFAIDAAATLTTEAAKASAVTCFDIEGASYITNYPQFYYPTPTDRAYLNAANLTGEPVASTATAYFFVEATAETTAAEIETALFALQHPNAKIIAPAGAAARTQGTFMAVDETGKLINTNTLDLNAVWDFSMSPDGNYYIKNLGKEGYLYTSSMTLADEPVEVKMTDSPVLFGAVGFTTDLDAETSQRVFLNALGHQPTIATWDLDEGSSFFAMPYKATMTTESVKEQVVGLFNDGKAKISYVNMAKATMNSSSEGQMYGEEYISALENASGNEAIAAAGKEAVQQAINFAEQNIGSGFALFHNKTEQYFNYIADNATVPFQRADETDATSMWVAEWVVEADAQAEDAPEYTTRNFMLRNVASGKYIGNIALSNAAPAVVDMNSAAVMKLVPTNNGFTILQTSNTLSNAYLSAFNDTDAGAEAAGKLKSLTMWTDANDANSLFSFFDLPTMSQEESWLDFDGEYTEDDMMMGKMFTSINGVEIVAPQGGSLTGIGEVIFGTLPDEYDFDNIEVVKTWTAEEIAEITPVNKEITRSRYDIDADDFIEETITVPVYVLPLGKTITEPATYVAKASKYIFVKDFDGETLYSDLMSANTTLEPTPEAAPFEVTPAAGTVKSVSEIALGTFGWYADPEAEGNMTVTYNGEITTDANGEKLDCDAMTVDMTYYVYDPEADKDGYFIPVNFETAGKYVLTIPEAFFSNPDEYLYNEATTVEWTIEKKDGINEVTSVKVNGVEIYDLSGRKLAKPTRGINIVNGVKTMVK